MTKIICKQYRVFLLPVLALLLLSSCSQDEKDEKSRAEAVIPLKPPVIIISCDTLRADHVGCYGYARNTTPMLDKFAADAVRFTNAFTPEVWTLTAHMTMLTGLNPEHHGLAEYLNLPEAIPTLPERLEAAWYTCGGFVGFEWWFQASRGYGRGFDAYQTPKLYCPIETTHAAAVDWLETQKNRPVFLFLHNYDIHSKLQSPGNPRHSTKPFDVENDDFRIFTKGIPEPALSRPSHPQALATAFLAAHNNGLLEITDEEKEFMLRAYDECVYKVDYESGKLFTKLKETPYGDSNFYDAALIIVTSDHGESLGTHNAYIHGNVYEENIRVPLLIKFPKNEHAGQTIDAMVQHADLTPTILDYLNLEMMANSDGVSLIPLVQGEAPDEKTLFTKRNLWRAMRTMDLKLVYNIADGFSALFNIKDDPNETQDLQFEQPEVAKKMGRSLLAHYYPPDSGWKIELTDVIGDLECEISITSEAHIVAIDSLKSELVSLPIKIGAKVNQSPIMIKFSHEYSGETLAVRTEPVGAPISVSVHASHPIQNALSPQAPPLTDFTLELGREKSGTRSASVKPGNPIINAYYTSPQSEKQTSTQLSPQAIEELKALGYLDTDNGKNK